MGRGDRDRLTLHDHDEALIQAVVAVNPSAKLPCSFPKSEAQLPYFNKNADRITYGMYHDYWLME
jgi:hypothetical protein